MTYNRFTILACAFVTGFGCGSTLGQQPQDEFDSEMPRSGVRRVHRVTNEFKKLGDWSQHVDALNGMLDRIWAQNHWESEEDQFARHVARQVMDIPPWQFNERIGKATELVAERYHLDEPQKARLQSRIYREMFGFVIRHADVFASQTQEFVGAWMEGQPFTAEQVAKWTRESDPAFIDAQSRVERMIERSRDEMRPFQRTILDRDAEALDRRMRHLMQMRSEWKRGQWRPADWGFAGDEGVMESRIERHPSARVDGAIVPLGRDGEAAIHHPAGAVTFVAGETEWQRYVREFIARYDLDAGQIEAIRSILHELESRADQLRGKRTTEQRDSEPATADARLAEMFEELKTRSRALLRKPQRTGDGAEP